MSNIRTDLALEARELYRGQAAEQEVPGVSVQTEQRGDVAVTRVIIKNQEGEQALGKPRGTYTTLDIPSLTGTGRDVYESTCRAVAAELQQLVDIPPKSTVLVVGLGNWNVTPDALGPQVVGKLLVTRHLFSFMPDALGEGVRPVCAVSPGVLGLTGVETGEIIKGVVDRVKPALVIAVDALAARDMKRISTTIQLADTGISPGAGVGNKRKELSKTTLGVPVIAVGVPTVIDAATITSDALDLMVEAMQKAAEPDSAFYRMLQDMNKEERYALVNEVLSPHLGNFMVTPKEVDTMIEKIAKVLANGINIALHEGIGFDDIDEFLA